MPNVEVEANELNERYEVKTGEHEESTTETRYNVPEELLSQIPDELPCIFWSISWCNMTLVHAAVFNFVADLLGV